MWLLSFLVLTSLIFPGCHLQMEEKEPSPTVEVTISPKIAIRKCSGERQEIVCQLNDFDDRLKKQMLETQSTNGYGGYIEFLLIRKGRTGKEMIVQETHLEDPYKLNIPVQMPVENLTIFDDGAYSCKVIWHSYSKDRSWQSLSFSLNVYDCIDLTTEHLQASIKETVILNCIDVDVPMRWYKEGDDIDEDKTKLLNATTRDRRHPPHPTSGPMNALPTTGLIHPHPPHPNSGSVVPHPMRRHARQAGVRGMTTPAPSFPPRHGLRPLIVLSEDDAGIYSCKATFEDTQQIFTKNNVVNLKTPPTSATNIRTMKVSPSSVILRWDMKPVANQYIHAEATFFTIFYRPIEGGQLLSKTVLKIPEVMLTNLKPNTVYFVRIQAENELGTSPSASRIVVTPAANEMVEVDKRQLDIMRTHMKILEQDLGSITSVLREILTEDEKEQEASPPQPTAKPPRSQ